MYKCAYIGTKSVVKPESFVRLFWNSTFNNSASYVQRRTAVEKRRCCLTVGAWATRFHSTDSNRQQWSTAAATYVAATTTVKTTAIQPKRGGWKRPVSEETADTKKACSCCCQSKEWYQRTKLISAIELVKTTENQSLTIATQRYGHDIDLCKSIFRVKPLDGY